jgi:hypothetical protein
MWCTPRTAGDSSAVAVVVSTTAAGGLAYDWLLYGAAKQYTAVAVNNSDL